MGWLDLGISDLINLISGGGGGGGGGGAPPIDPYSPDSAAGGGGATIYPYTGPPGRSVAEEKALLDARGSVDSGDLGSILGSGLGDILTNVLSGVATAEIEKLLTKAGVPSDVTNILGGAVASLGPSILNAGPGYTVAPQFFPSPQPFDPGGIGGGILTSAPYLGEAGKVAGLLLKSKKVSVNQLLTGGSTSVLAQLLQRRIA